MFIGEYRHSIDEKGRLAVPTKYRERLSGGAVVTRGLDRCLFIYPSDAWQELAGRLAKLPLSKANTRSFARFLLAGAMDVELDKQGRIVVPEYLRSFAGVRKSVVIAGLYNRMEVWDVDAWERYRNGAERGSAEIAETLESELGV
ncbi:division/cell wall cluster transcriptional repressor MraZ [Candidatus Uhrbacteria bacterium]|nr:division/cell wall cluster transcriptional repressor MraZ [Candidatus Uhrbacteria bacterium]